VGFEHGEVLEAWLHGRHWPAAQCPSVGAASHASRSAARRKADAAIQDRAFRRTGSGIAPPSPQHEHQRSAGGVSARSWGVRLRKPSHCGVRYPADNPPLGTSFSTAPRVISLQDGLQSGPPQVQPKLEVQLDRSPDIGTRKRAARAACVTRNGNAQLSSGATATKRMGDDGNLPHPRK